jgi:hypothetical protein
VLLARNQSQELHTLHLAPGWVYQGLVHGLDLHTHIQADITAAAAGQPERSMLLS